MKSLFVEKNRRVKFAVRQALSGYENKFSESAGALRGNSMTGFGISAHDNAASLR